MTNALSTAPEQVAAKALASWLASVAASLDRHLPTGRLADILLSPEAMNWGNPHTTFLPWQDNVMLGGKLVMHPRDDDHRCTVEHTGEYCRIADSSHEPTGVMTKRVAGPFCILPPHADSRDSFVFIFLAKPRDICKCIAVHISKAEIVGAAMEVKSLDIFLFSDMGLLQPWLARQCAHRPGMDWHKALEPGIKLLSEHQRGLLQRASAVTALLATLATA